MAENYQKELKALTLLKERAGEVSQVDDEIADDIATLKKQLMSMDGAQDIVHSPEFAREKERQLQKMGTGKPAKHTSLDEIYALAEGKYKQDVSLSDILDASDIDHLLQRLNDKMRKYGREIDSKSKVTCETFTKNINQLRKLLGKGDRIPEPCIKAALFGIKCVRDIIVYDEIKKSEIENIRHVNDRLAILEREVGTLPT